MCLLPRDKTAHNSLILVLLLKLTDFYFLSSDFNKDEKTMLFLFTLKELYFFIAVLFMPKLLSSDDYIVLP